jgi:hypothetical protein
MGRLLRRGELSINLEYGDAPRNDVNNAPRNDLLKPCNDVLICNDVSKMRLLRR